MNGYWSKCKKPNCQFVAWSQTRKGLHELQKAHDIDKHYFDEFSDWENDIEVHPFVISHRNANWQDLHSRKLMLAHVKEVAYNSSP